jgi:hypothetical protein
MVYTKAYLSLVKVAFAKPSISIATGHGREPFSVNEGRRSLRRCPRRYPASSAPNNNADGDRDVESDDEYNPSAPKRRRLAPSKNPRVKRVKPDRAPTGDDDDNLDIGLINTAPSTINIVGSTNNNVIANAGHTNVNAGLATASMVTLKLRSPQAIAYVKSIAPISKVTPPHGRHRPSIRTYMDMKDEESEQIDGGVTRSGLRRRKPQNSTSLGCQACNVANKRCSAKLNGQLPCKRCKEGNIKCVKHESLGSSESRSSTDKSLGGNFKGMISTSFLDPSLLTGTSDPAQSGRRPITGIRQAFSDIQVMRAGMGAGSLGMCRGDPIVLDSPSVSPEAMLPQFSTRIEKTPWAHPINFKVLTSDAEKPCHFCADFRYGIFGYGLIDAEIYQLPGEHQWNEAGRGHMSNGKEATRMCIKCALQRLYVVQCGRHVMKRFDTPAQHRVNSFMDQLCSKSYPGGVAIPRSWYHSCWLCSQPAFWICQADQTKDNVGNPLPMDKCKGRGCGLLVCESCATNLNCSGGKLTKNTVRKSNGSSCKRADMDFLFAGSLLYKAYKG